MFSVLFSPCGPSIFVTKISSHAAQYQIKDISFRTLAVCVCVFDILTLKSGCILAILLVKKIFIMLVFLLSMTWLSVLNL